VVLDCEACKRVYENDPPCDECNVPVLYPENFQIWEIWQRLSMHRGIGFSAPLRIDLGQLMNLCEMYDLAQEDFEMILKIEDVRYPMMLRED